MCGEHNAQEPVTGDVVVQLPDIEIGALAVSGIDDRLGELQAQHRTLRVDISFGDLAPAGSRVAVSTGRRGLGDRDDDERGHHDKLSHDRLLLCLPGSRIFKSSNPSASTAKIIRNHLSGNLVSASDDAAHDRIQPHHARLPLLTCPEG